MKPSLLSLSLIALLSGGSALAQTPAENLEVSGAFIRATLPRAPVGGAYATIANHGAEDDRLVSVSSPVGSSAEIHEMAHREGVMTMRELPEGLPIPAGETVVLAPGGLHVMINGLTAPLTKGETLELTLKFEKAGEVKVVFDVLPLNARSHPQAAAPHEGGH